MLKSRLIPDMTSEERGLVVFWYFASCICYGNQAVQRPDQLRLPAGCGAGTAACVPAQGVGSLARVGARGLAGDMQ